MSEEVRRMFARIARRYDIGNDVLSFGAHRLWKRLVVRETTPGAKGRVLDLATGTGDIAALYARSMAPGGEVIGADFCADMIDYARQRSSNSFPNIRFEIADAMALQYEDNSFDTTSISFGIRNVDDPVIALGEMRRVTRPGGRVVILETGQPKGLWGMLYRVYASTILPLAGGFLSGSLSAYRYLNRTASAFPYGENFVALMKRAGFRDVVVTPLLGGIAFFYSATVPATVETDAAQPANAEATS
jgi:demethylmenaquinone methyltransferase/2-methoxy-6-polyprenyl-1,4-benzoquinol methylase